MQHALPLDGYCNGPLFAPPVKRRARTRPRGKEGIVHRMQTRRATPRWLTQDHYVRIADFYRRARFLTRTRGEPWVVDHIVPKVSPWVCGLHVPWNLEVVDGPTNTRKSNTWWPDMWAPQQELFQ